MTATVRAFYFAGTVQTPGVGTRLATDSVQMLKFPWLASDSVTVDTGTAQSIDAAPAGAKLLVVQVQAGKSVHVEINDPNRSTAANTGSYIISGEQSFAVGESWSASFLEFTVV